MNELLLHLLLLCFSQLVELKFELEALGQRNVLNKCRYVGKSRETTDEAGSVNYWLKHRKIQLGNQQSSVDIWCCGSQLWYWPVHGQEWRSRDGRASDGQWRRSAFV